MGEGNTPLVPGMDGNVSFKLESTNPTGSYKDRFIAAELTNVLLQNRSVCVATSSGNTGSSLAAYCARYGVRCVIVVNADAPSGKLLQMRAHGATVLGIPEFVTSPEVTQAVFATLEAFTASEAASLIVSAFKYCPVGMSAVKRIATEIVAQSPDVRHVFVPVGGGGLFAAISAEMQAIHPQARVHAVQPEGCPTVWNAYRLGLDTVESVTSTTRISGLSVPFDIDAGLALRLVRSGGGQVIPVSDAKVFAAQTDMLRHEGIYCEPAGATALAGYRRAVAAGSVAADEHSVCVVTGHGFKDPRSIEASASDSGVRRCDAAELAGILDGMLRGVLR